jgi:hypothetical protein
MWQSGSREDSDWEVKHLDIVIIIIILVVLGFELRASHLPGRHPTLLKPVRQPFFVLGIFEIRSLKLFAQAGFEQRSSWSLLPE